MSERPDKLRIDYINSLPHPFLARFCGDNTFWPVNNFEAGTGLMRIDVRGKLPVKNFGDVMEMAMPSLVVSAASLPQPEMAYSNVGPARDTGPPPSRKLTF